MSDFKILQVSDDPPREWTNNKGEPMLSYEVEFKGDQAAGFADVNKKPTSKPPEAGEVYDEFKPAKGNFKGTLKKTWKPAGQTSMSGGGEHEFRSKEQIMRSYAHSQALQWIATLAQIGKLEKLEWSEYLRYVDQFYEDVRGAS